jgi:Type IV secretion system pilin
MWLLQYFGATCSHSFFGIPPWYKYLIAAGKLDDTCRVTNLKIPDDLSLVALGIVDILLRLAGLVAVGYVIYGGIQYVVSQGEPDRTKRAQGTIVNALIGLAITIVSVAIVSFIGNKVGS